MKRITDQKINKILEQITLEITKEKIRQKLLEIYVSDCKGGSNQININRNKAFYNSYINNFSHIIISLILCSIITITTIHLISKQEIINLNKDIKNIAIYDTTLNKKSDHYSKIQNSSVSFDYINNERAIPDFLDSIPPKYKLLINTSFRANNGIFPLLDNRIFSRNDTIVLIESNQQNRFLFLDIINRNDSIIKTIDLFSDTTIVLDFKPDIYIYKYYNPTGPLRYGIFYIK